MRLAIKYGEEGTHRSFLSPSAHSGGGIEPMRHSNTP